MHKYGYELWINIWTIWRNNAYLRTYKGRYILSGTSKSNRTRKRFFVSLKCQDMQIILFWKVKCIKKTQISASSTIYTWIEWGVWFWSIKNMVTIWKMQHFSKKCCIFYLTVTISDINSNTLPLITLNFKNLFALYWV